MASLNLVQIIGNLGRDPDYFAQEGRQPFCNLSVATTRKYHAQDGSPKEETEWHRVVVYDNSATACQRYLRQGSSVYVAGRLKSRKYTDRTGAERQTTEIIASDVQFLSWGGQREDRAPAQQASAAPAQDFEDAPF